MAFTVEDGTGLASANAYVAVADANTYHTDRSNSAWAGSDALKQAAIIKATAYIDGMYRDRFKGYRKTDTQALEWPRSYAYAPNGSTYAGVPTALKNAVCEAALFALGNSFYTTASSSGGNASVSRKMERAGDVERDIEYAYPLSGTSSKPVYLRVVEDALGILLRGGTNSLERG